MTKKNEIGKTLMRKIYNFKSTTYVPNCAILRFSRV